jgi:hypothetical protein
VPGQPPPGLVPKCRPVREVLPNLWPAAEQLCGKRLAPALALGLPHYAKHFNPLQPSQKELLAQISPATIDRLLADCKATPRGLCGPRPGTLLRQQIPIAGEVWDERHPGLLEVDSVAHCGGRLAGDFIRSLTYTGLASGWTEGRAVWNKGYPGVLTQTQDVEARLSFALRRMDFDNGGEWLNWQLVRCLQECAVPVQLTRSRPYHKDDNAHVEQKNRVWPRQLLGYRRLDNVQTVEPICERYRDGWGPLHNFFLPSAKLVQKTTPRQPDRSPTRRAADGLSTALGQRPAYRQGAPAIARPIRILGPLRAGPGGGATPQKDVELKSGLTESDGGSKRKPRPNEPGAHGFGPPPVFLWFKMNKTYGVLLS